MILGVRNRGYVIFGESASGGKRMAFSGKTRNKKDVCEMCVSVCVHTHTLKIGVHLNVLKRGTKIHTAKKEKLKTIAREVKAEQR